MELAGVGEQAGIEIAHGIAQLVIVCVQFVNALQQLNLAFHILFGEQFNGFFHRTLCVAYGQVFGNDFLHAKAQAADVFFADFPAQAQLAIETAVYGGADEQFFVGIEVFGSLDQHKEERADVGAHSGHAVKTEELHVLVVIEAEVHALNLVVYQCGHRTVFHVQPRGGIDLGKRASQGGGYDLIVVLASYFQRVVHCAKGYSILKVVSVLPYPRKPPS